jgi:hypothetical protein
MSFDLAVVAAEPGADEATARAVIDRCYSLPHVEGELDERVVGFYEELQAIYPDHPPYDPDAPWALMPLDTGVDHVFMNISYSADDAVIEAIERLAAQHGLVIYDPQGDAVYLPPA